MKDAGGEAERMAEPVLTKKEDANLDDALIRMLDRGIEDVRAGRILPHDEAMKEVRRIRDERRGEREAQQPAVSK